MHGDTTTALIRLPDKPEQHKRRHPLLRMLMSQNPFYLISVAFVFHGSSLWFQARPDQSPWVLMGLVTGFISLMAITAFVLVRWGKVWDDARSIFVLVLVLFVELALAFDDTLVLRPRVGVPLLLCGYAFCTAVFESLLLGLKVRLRAAWRVPMHLMLALLFLYPLTLLPSIAHSPKTMLPWQLFGFSAIVGLVVLTLVPAVRGGRASVTNNGTPWPYPLFPWVPVGIVLTGLCIRAYAACASFDPSPMQSYVDAMKLQSIFAGYFAVPLVLAIGVLFLEAGRYHAVLARLGLLAPALAFWLAMPSDAWSVPQASFAHVFATNLGSPLFATLLLACVFFGLGLLRRVAGAGTGLSIATCLLAVVGPSSMSFPESPTPDLWLVLALACAHVAIGYRRQSTAQCLLAMVLACFVADSTLAQFGPEIRFGVEINVLMLGVIAAGVITGSFDLQVVGSCLATIMSALVLLPIDVLEQVPMAWRTGYAVSLFTIVLAITVRWRLGAYLAACVGTGASLFGFVGYEIWQLVKDWPGIRGLLFYAAGVAWFLLAAAISIVKARHRARMSPE